MAKKIEMVSSKDSPTGVAGRRVNGEFIPNAPTSTPQPEPTAAPQPTPLIQDGAIDATQISVPSSANVPEPTADAEAEVFQMGLQEQVDTARIDLEQTLKSEYDAALKRQEELNQQKQSLMKERDPENRKTFDQEERIIQNHLDAAETGSATLKEDFKKRRATVSELDRLLTEGNALIAQKKNQPVALSVLNKSVNKTIQDVHARAGVLQSVISALDGNIAQAHNIINTAQGTVRAYWQDQQNYNAAYMELVESGQLAKNKIESDYAQSQITLAENKLNQLEETSNYLKELMIDPQTAQFVADAGITLNDSVEEINTKLAEQSRIQEIQDVKNELVGEGYEYLGTSDVVFDRPDAVELEIGGKKLLFVPPVDDEVLSVAEAKSLGVPYGTTASEAASMGITPSSGGSGGGVGFTSQETRKLEQAGLAGASRQEQLDFLYGRNGGKDIKIDETPLIAAGMTMEDVQDIKAAVRDFGINEVLESLESEDEKRAVREALDIPEKVTSSTIEQTVDFQMRSGEIDAVTILEGNYTTEEIRKLAKDAGYAGWWGLSDEELEEYLGSRDGRDEAKKIYTELLKEQYRNAGMLAD